MESEREDVNVTEKRLIIEVLELYKDFPCLWDTADKLYCNKEARNQALEIILEKWKTGYPRATIGDIKKKLERLRAAYRRERNKVEASKSSGAGTEDLHIPSLWYYPYLTFLNEKTNPTSEGIDNFEESSDLNIQEPATKKGRYSIKKQQNDIIKKQEDLIDTAKQLLSSSGEESSADAFGHSVTSQLKELPKLQRCLTEKLIGEILFYAKLGELNFNTNINLNKNLHSLPQTRQYSTQPTRSLVPQYQLQSHFGTIIPSPIHSSPSPQYVSLSSDHPSPSPQRPTPSPQYVSLSSHHPSPSPQRPTPSPTDSLITYSMDTQSQYSSAGQVQASASLNDFPNTYGASASSPPSEFNTNNDLSESVFRGQMKDVHKYLIFKK